MFVQHNRRCVRLDTLVSRSSSNPYSPPLTGVNNLLSFQGADGRPDASFRKIGPFLFFVFSSGRCWTNLQTTIALCQIILPSDVIEARKKVGSAAFSTQQISQYQDLVERQGVLEEERPTEIGRCYRVRCLHRYIAATVLRQLRVDQSTLPFSPYLFLLCCLHRSVNLLNFLYSAAQDLENLHSRYNVEALLWSFALGIYILRFMTLGTKINKKYRNLSILITEQVRTLTISTVLIRYQNFIRFHFQINLYLQMEQKPHKKDELMVANSVLKLAADLIKVRIPFLTHSDFLSARSLIPSVFSFLRSWSLRSKFPGSPRIHICIRLQKLFCSRLCQEFSQSC